jgi:DNA-binding LacI/PurR family transcriptional regulator
LIDSENLLQEFSGALHARSDIVFRRSFVPTIREVARAADVSVATVSRVLNNTATVSPGVRDRVLEVAGRMRYGAAGAGARALSSHMALVYTGPSSLSSPYDVAILDGMSQAAEAAGLDLLITREGQGRRPNETATQFLTRKGIRGAVLRTTSDTRHLCVELAKEGFPSVVVGERFDDGGDEADVSFIYADSRPTSYQAVEHLISIGHRRIAVVLNQVADNDHQDRLGAYEQALREHGIEVDPRLVVRVGAQRPNGAQVIRTLMSLRDRPTAIFIADPPIAVGAINQAHEMGVRIPDDVSIIGFDDADTRNDVYPALSAICQDAHRLGYEAARALSQRLQGHADEPVRAVHPTWLELHGTVGTPPDVAARVLPDGSRIS